jgi:CBS domain-containing protein
MHARQVMTKPVVTVPADATVYAAAEILLGSGISGAPVVDADGRMIGIVSEADLMHRPEIGTIPARSWLQRLLGDSTVLARAYVRSHSHHVADVMTRDVVTADEHTPLGDIAGLMQRHRVRRIPIVRDGKVVGIVSRANLLQGLLSREPFPTEGPDSDETLRTRVEGELSRHSWASGTTTNVVVDKAVVHLWGHVRSVPLKDAIGIAAENVPGIRRVVNNLAVLPPEVGA